MPFDKELSQEDEVVVVDESEENAPALEEVPKDEPAAPAASKYEEDARAQGWVPKEEWDGDPEDWTDAREFVKRGELFHKISNQSKEIKELHKSLGMLLEHHGKVKETEYKRALEYLKSEKKKALVEGDADQLLAVDDAIDMLKQEHNAEKTATTAAGGPRPPSQNFVSWVQQNQWYVKDAELREFADDFGTGYKSRHPETTELELYRITRDKVMKAFPDKFRGSGSKVPSVEGTGSPPTKPAEVFKITDEEKRVMNTFVRNGIMTKEEYLTELKRIKNA